MNRFFVMLTGMILLCFSCNRNSGKAADLPAGIKGDWLILYPDHRLKNSEQRKIYGAVQDSIVGLLGLKTISFLDDRIFYQTDSLYRSAGQWNFNPEDKSIIISNGGDGLDPFKGTLIDIVNDTMRIAEDVLLSGQKIRLVWHFKKITDKKQAGLFSLEKNWWRKVGGPENEQQLKDKVKALLNYYALYYEMVAKESAYFSYSRVFLPFNYYQHSMRLKHFNEHDKFCSFFNNVSDALKAHTILQAAMNKVADEKFPSGNNFVIEYALFMNRLASVIE